MKTLILVSQFLLCFSVHAETLSKAVAETLSLRTIYEGTSQNSNVCDANVEPVILEPNSRNRTARLRLSAQLLFGLQSYQSRTLESVGSCRVTTTQTVVVENGKTTITQIKFERCPESVVSPFDPSRTTLILGRDAIEYSQAYYKKEKFGPALKDANGQWILDPNQESVSCTWKVR